MKREGGTATDERLRLVLPRMPERRRSIVSYALAMSDSLIGGFDAADFREDIAERKFLWFHHFLVNHPDGVKHILQDNAANYIKATIVLPLLAPALGNGLVTSEGDAWRWHRRIMTPAFGAKSVAGYAGIVTEATDAMLRTWDEDGSDSSFDLEGAMKELTLDIIARTMFSSDSELIKDTLHQSSTRYQAEMNLSPFALIPGINRVWARLKERRAAWLLKDLNVLMERLIESRKTRSSEPRKTTCWIGSCTHATRKQGAGYRPGTCATRWSPSSLPGTKPRRWRSAGHGSCCRNIRASSGDCGRKSTIR